MVVRRWSILTDKSHLRLEALPDENNAVEEGQRYCKVHKYLTASIEPYLLDVLGDGGLDELGERPLGNHGLSDRRC